MTEEVLDFLKKQAEGAKYVTSVCTGSLVFGAAGLLLGYRAATHWTAIDYLADFGAIPAKTRVCVDRNRVTGGGVTAGIDFALTLASILVDRQDRRRRFSSASNITRRRRSIPVHPTPRRRRSSHCCNERIAGSRQRRSEAVHRAAARLAPQKIPAA